MKFQEFFKKATGFGPFPYQASLANADMSHMALAAPTGAGKTAAAIIAWLWQRQQNPKKTPTRLILCEPQRTLVEQTYNVAKSWLENLDLIAEHDSQTDLYNKNTKKVSIHAMQGGFIDEKWELCPEQPAIIIGTQDQLLSRALNRGYAMSRFRWPIHFGLFHNDCQWVFDEIQLMGPGLTTSAQLHGLRNKLGTIEPAHSLWMSATLRKDWLKTVDHPIDGKHNLTIHPFTAADEEKMAQRLQAKKPLFPLPVSLNGGGKKDVEPYLKEVAELVINLHRKGQFTLVILNTVDRARSLYRKLKKSLDKQTLYLLHSRFRPVDRNKILEKIQVPDIDKIVISTQVVEAGVDISADILITELAPKASMIQRFGRCNRKGEQDHAEVHWIDLTDEKAGAPYLMEDLERSRDFLQTLTQVNPGQFLLDLGEEWPLYDTLRRKDLLELFDTTSDLSGLTVDIGRFIRDGEDRDVFLFWRDWSGLKPSLDLNVPTSGEPAKGELCRVSIVQAKKAAEKTDLWHLDDLEGNVGSWRSIRPRDITPGKTYLLAAKSGHYTNDEGWSPGSKTKVVVPPPKDLDHSPFPKMASDPLSSERQCNLSLEDHTLNVCDELELLLSTRPVEDRYRKILEEAALWHDIGKAHPVFQDTMHRGSAPDDGTLWAKCVGKAFHSQRYFRHEFASALAALGQSQLDFLSIYLIASHHGKARLSIRAFPDEEAEFVLGVQDQSVLPPIHFKNLKIPSTVLTHEVLEFGRDSWQDRCLKLRDNPALGPFRIAYLESLLRAADVRASIKEKREAINV